MPVLINDAEEYSHPNSVPPDWHSPKASSGQNLNQDVASSMQHLSKTLEEVSEKCDACLRVSNECKAILEKHRHGSRRSSRHVHQQVKKAGGPTFGSFSGGSFGSFSVADPFQLSKALGHGHDHRDEHEDEGRRSDFDSATPTSASLVAPNANARQTRRAQKIANVGDVVGDVDVKLGRCAHFWNFLEDSESSVPAWYFASSSRLIIMASVIVSLLQVPIYPDQSSPLSGYAAAIVDTFFDVLFMVEIIIRMAVCPSLSHLFSRITTHIDLLSACGLIVRASTGFALEGEETVAVLFITCLLPVIRLAKMIRHFETLQLLLNAFESVLAAMPVLFFIFSCITLAASAALYVVEPRTNLKTLPEAVWLCIVTISTVGYGDTTPSSPAGYFTVSVLVCVSALFLAMPVGIVGTAFNNSWESRDQVLLISRTREAMRKMGYKASDIKLLFEHISNDGSGELELPEFMELLTQMRIGLKPERIIKLFRVFDDDNSGNIDHEEFIRFIFPSYYIEAFNEQPDADFEKTVERTSTAFAHLRQSRASTKVRQSSVEEEAPS